MKNYLNKIKNGNIVSMMLRYVIYDGNGFKRMKKNICVYGIYVFV